MAKKNIADQHERINQVLDLLLRYTQMDFSARGTISENGDEIDAIMVGLNTLGEELKDKLDDRTTLETDSDARLAAIIDSSDDAIVSKDLSGVIRSWNRSAERIFGYTAEEAIGQHIELIIPDEYKSEEKIIISQIRNGRKIDHFETIRQRKDGTRIDVSLTVSPIRDRTGMIIGASKIARDITEQKRMEREIRAKTAYMETRVGELLDVLLKYTLLDFSVTARIGEQGDEFDAIAVGLNTMAEELQAEISRRKTYEQALVDKSNELASSNRDLENFAYVASHDLQEPLRMVSSFLQLLQKKLGDALDQDSKDYIFYAVDGAKRMKEMINDLLSYSRLSSKKGEFKAVDMNQVMEEVRSNLQEKITESNAKIECARLPEILADRIKMTRLLQNLVANALKFTKKGEAPFVQIASSEDASAYTFSVKDNGIGMKPEYFTRIFGIFQRLHSQSEYQGTGIGLAECKKIAELHGGRIWVESEPDKGSTFYFTISKKLKKGITESL
jgi:PAS domain S-box-containing protein